MSGRRSSGAKAAKAPAVAGQPSAASAAQTQNQQTWAQLQLGVDRIVTALREGIDMKTYMNLYSLVHNFCTSQKGIAQASPALQGTSGARGGESSPLRAMMAISREEAGMASVEKSTVESSHRAAPLPAFSSRSPQPYSLPLLPNLKLTFCSTSPG